MFYSGPRDLLCFPHENEGWGRKIQQSARSWMKLSDPSVIFIVPYAVDQKWTGFFPKYLEFVEDEQGHTTAEFIRASECESTKRKMTFWINSLKSFAAQSGFAEPQCLEKTELNKLICMFLIQLKKWTVQTTKSSTEVTGTPGATFVFNISNCQNVNVSRK